jgi:hypothetical protein
VNVISTLEEAVAALKGLRTLDGIGRGDDPSQAAAECAQAVRLADEALRLACEVKANAYRGRRTPR